MTAITDDLPAQLIHQEHEQWEAMGRGEVQVLVMLDVNPVYDAPGDLGFLAAEAVIEGERVTVEGRGFAAGLLDLVDDFLRRGLLAAGAVESDADVVDDDPGAFTGGHFCDGRADAAAGTGDYDDLAFHHFRICHDALNIYISD